jgi:DNA-binding transcriptional regulator YiaG
MMGTTLRTIQTRFDFRQDTMARRIPVATDTVARWERNEFVIHKPMEHVIRLLESHNNW